MLAALCASSFHAHARAQARDPVELTWHAPAGCSSVEEVQARIRKLLGPARVSGARLRADATITRSAPERLLLTLIVRDGELVGERHIEGSACEDLAGATAVNLVLQLRSDSQPTAAAVARARTARSRLAPAGPELRESNQQPQTQGEAQASPTVAQAEGGPVTQPPPLPTNAVGHEENTPPIHAAEHVERGWRGLLQLQLRASVFGPMPRPSFGLGLAAGVQLARWRLLVDGNLWLKQSLPASDPTTVGAQAERVDAGLLVCRSVLLERIELAPCTGVSLEHMWARGTGVRVAARTAESTWVAAGVGLQARFVLTDWLGLIAGVDGQFELARPSVTIAGFGRVGQLGPAALRLNFGAEWIL
jgi:hypothetical protein